MSEHMSDVTFGKVFAGMLAGMVALTIFLIILAHAVGGGIPESDVKTKARDEVTQARTAPEGSLAVGEVAAQPAVQVAASAPSGEQVYQSACAVCHAAGVAGAPKLGDAVAWNDRIAKGKNVLYDHAINGFNAMPAKGGNMSLSDEAVKAAVDHMVGGEGAAQQTSGSAGGSSTGQTAETQVAAADPAVGKGVYDASCAVCHVAGVAGAPKQGDAAAWESRLKQGQDVLYQHAINGINAMPAKGGNAGLSDDEVKAAVDYLISTLQ